MGNYFEQIDGFDNMTTKEQIRAINEREAGFTEEKIAYTNDLLRKIVNGERDTDYLLTYVYSEDSVLSYLYEKEKDHEKYGEDNSTWYDNYYDLLTLRTTKVVGFLLQPPLHMLPEGRMRLTRCPQA